MDSTETLFEFRRIGRVVKVTAIDPETRIEVSIQGPSSLSEAALARAALAKLRHMLARKGR